MQKKIRYMMMYKPKKELMANMPHAFETKESLTHVYTKQWASIMYYFLIM
jgi:hypothetical protein